MNQLKVKEQQAIIALYEQGWSKRKIARELGLDRLTVRRYIAAAGSKSPTPQTGSGEAVESKSPGVQTGSSSGGLCARWGEQIEQWLGEGPSVQRIYQDLVAEHQFAGSYHSVRRFVLRLQPAGAELPFRRMECAPGEELQIDFGQGELGARGTWGQCASDCIFPQYDSPAFPPTCPPVARCEERWLSTSTRASLTVGLPLARYEHERIENKEVNEGSPIRGN